MAFGKKQDKVFTLGAKYGSYSTGFRNPNAGDYQDPFYHANNQAQSTDVSSYLQNIFGQADAATKNTGDYMIGVMLDAPMGKTADIRIGLSADHIFTPRLGIDTQDTTGTATPLPRQAEELDRRINAFVFLYTDINKKLTFNPNILYQKSGVSTNLVVQALFNYLYSKEKDISLIAGIGARLVNDFDIPLYLAMDMKDLRVGLSYDANVGGLRPSTGTFGALELGITKIFNWSKKPVVNPVFICPRL